MKKKSTQSFNAFLMRQGRKERLKEAQKIYESAPETVRTPAQQKAYERAKINDSTKGEHTKKRTLPRASFVRGGIPSLGKRR